MVRLTAVMSVAALALFPAISLADSPHFVGTPSASVANNGVLSVSFKEAGLGTTTSSERITLTVQEAEGLYQCWNNGGQHPKAGNKETVSTPINNTGTFPVRNGSASGTIPAGPPGAGDFTCPSGQTLVLMAVEYEGIYVVGSAGTDTTEAEPDPVCASRGGSPTSPLTATTCPPEGTEPELQ